VALLQAREHGINPLQIPWLFGLVFPLMRHDQVFPDRQRRKDPAPLRYQTDPEPLDTLGA
jgi:hypothetical protein